MRITVGKNLDDVKSAFETLPAGQYPVRCTKVEKKIGKDSGQPYLNFEFEIQDEAYKGRKLWSIGSLQEQSLFALKNILEGIGVPYDAEGFDTDDCVGQDAIAEVVVKPGRTEEEASKNEIKKLVCA